MSILLDCLTVFFLSLTIAVVVGNFFHIQSVKQAFPNSELKLRHIFRDRAFCLIVLCLAVCFCARILF